MKSIFNSIFSKNNKPIFQNQSNHNLDSKDIPHFSILESKPQKSDYEVAEISYEEFKNSVLMERRKHPRKSGETRREYLTKQKH
jgi:hypothetical protein